MCVCMCEWVCGSMGVYVWVYVCGCMCVGVCVWVYVCGCMCVGMSIDYGGMCWG